MPRRDREEGGDADAEDQASKRVRSPYARGAIYRVKLHNFMSYTDAEIVDPGPQLNCIIGANGTGKSSIVCALCVGLGGPLKITERGDKISACVHGGGSVKDAQGNLIDSGYVETELVDGNGPGRNLVVRLDFDMRDKEIWRLDGATTTKTEVKKRMAKLNIQVDNPLQFLPQDKVGQFTTMGPIELLKHTEMAIGPAVYQKHQDLIALDAELKKVKQRLGTEQKTLDDLNAALAALQRDVERWNAYQASLEKLRQMKGKALWLKQRQAEEEMLSMKGEFDAKKLAVKELERQKKQLDEKLKPLEELKKSSVAMHQTAVKELGAKKDQTQKVGAKVDELQEVIEEKRAAIKSVEGQLKKIRLEREKVEEDIKRDEETAKVTRQKIETQFRQPADQVVKQMREEAAKAQKAHNDASNAVEDHKSQADELQQGVQHAERNLQQLDDVKEQKMRLMSKLNSAAAQLAYSIEQEGMGGDVIGPLLMEIDVINPQQRQLVEQVINVKVLSAFIARSDGARDALNQMVGGKPVNIYRYKGKPYEPRARPSSKELKQFGITAWLDEALTMKPENRGDVLGVLRDNCGVDLVLLGTSKTGDSIKELQEYLASKGMSGSRVITPERVYEINRSKYGQKAMTTQTKIPRPAQRHFDNVVDEAEVRKRKQAVQNAQAALEEHARGGAGLQAAVDASSAELQKVKERKAVIDTHTQLLRTLQGRAPAQQQKLAKAVQKENDFNAEERKSSMRKELQAAHEASLDQAAKLVAAIGAAEAARRKADGAQLALKAAEVEMEESKEESSQLQAQVEAGRRVFEDLKAKCKQKAKEVQEVLAHAREKAPEFEAISSEGSGGERTPEAEAAWGALASDAATLEDEVEALETDTNEDVASADAIKQHQTKTRKIEEETERVAQTTEEVQTKQAALQATEAEWKPALNQMVESVDRSFSRYFARFNCSGEVILSDGRALDEEGNPYGEDVYSNYKIHIKVKWRANEELHVLGESGRDSGGERSVATMVYLISLQNINPAPFRVVDEINQAMDSSNERNVFQCITAACSQGGKQYFLLTPKLLADLDYGEDTAIQFVYNGPYMQAKDAFSLPLFT